MGQKRNLENTVDQAELARPRAELLLNRWLPLRERNQPDVQSGTLEPMHGGEKGERPFALAELAAHPEIGLVTREVAPEQVAKVGIGSDLGPQRHKIERWPLGREHVIRHDEPAAENDAARIDPAPSGR